MPPHGGPKPSVASQSENGHNSTKRNCAETTPQPHAWLDDSKWVNSIFEDDRRRVVTPNTRMVRATRIRSTLSNASSFVTGSRARAEICLVIHFNIRRVYIYIVEWICVFCAAAAVASTMFPGVPNSPTLSSNNQQRWLTAAPFNH